MSREPDINPFDITKAVDFSDCQINELWVDLLEGGGFTELVKPRSPMPMIILGGKGSGKTHLMRYFSFPVQIVRHKSDVETGIRADGYIGIYLRCGGLNASRFSAGDDVALAAAFPYYMDLWIAQLTIRTINDYLKYTRIAPDEVQGACREILELFDVPIDDKLVHFSEIENYLHELQRMVDKAINNYVITRRLDFEVTASPGRLVFGIPKIVSMYFSVLEDVQILYLLDELENLSESQQKYINTLIREREPPASFKVGAKLYGIRTYSTYSAGETNKEGSEYEVLPLDRRLRNKSGIQYRKFAQRLCIRRLQEAGYLSAGVQPKEIDKYFDAPVRERYYETESNKLVERYSGRDKPYFFTLRKKLQAGILSDVAPGLNTTSEINAVIDALRTGSALIEKVNAFLLYQDWYSGKNLNEAAKDIALDCQLYLSDKEVKTRHKHVLGHFAGDLLAQLRRECGFKQQYVGFEDFVDMSSALPRNLLVILKHIFQWSSFNGEDPFREGKQISYESQKAGIMEATEWFYRDARIPGANGQYVRSAINKLATLFRDIRFSDKPTECSLSTFSVNLHDCSETTQLLIELAESWSLLINVRGGQKDRNTSRVDVKYQLNPMLAPRWDLPIHRRGAIALRPEEVNSIFDPQYDSDFQRLSKIRVDRMMAPYFGKQLVGVHSVQNVFPGFDND